jgi:AraC-like DNA-binding protein
MFRVCPVHFDQRHCAITFHRSQLALPVRQDLASLTEYLRRPVYEMIVQDYDRFSWTARVRELIAGNAAADDSLSAIARELGTHEHTLRRRLADEGYSFIDLKREVKRDLAVDLLSGRRRSIEEVAFAIGFSEASAFIQRVANIGGEWSMARIVATAQDGVRHQQRSICRVR